MEPSTEQKIDQIYKDAAYMRGQWDATIPDLKRTVITHSENIGDLQRKQSNMTGKSGVIGAIAGSAVGAFFIWVFHIK